MQEEVRSVLWQHWDTMSLWTAMLTKPRDHVFLPSAFGRLLHHWQHLTRSAQARCNTFFALFDLLLQAHSCKLRPSKGRYIELRKPSDSMWHTHRAVLRCLQHSVVACRSGVQHFSTWPGQEAETPAGPPVSAGHLCMCGSLPQLECCSSPLFHGCNGPPAGKHSPP